MRWRIALALLVAAAGAVYLFNASWLAPMPEGPPALLAHRGVHHTYHRDGLTADSCTATMIFPPEHGLFENTLASMQAAFEAGAAVVELDIHPTTDGAFAVFHDWTLDCRTDGRGVTREHALADLKGLDIGYGYTADGGRTYPLRGKGVGLMPSLDEVLAAFPDRRLLINIKSNDPAEGEMLAQRLAAESAERRQQLMVYGAEAPVREVERRLPETRILTRQGLRDCLVGYIATGWFGRVPPACAGTLVLVPVNVAPWLWGWPHRFLARMRAADAEVIVVGPYDGGNFSTGIDDAAALARLPPRFDGGIWTNRIEVIAPLVRDAAGR